jgi:large subunit ribosomal protein L10
MSKHIKQMQMDVLSKTFDGVRDRVFLSASKVDAITENKVRLDLRKKNIAMLMVKNSLLRRVFADNKFDLADDVWIGPTVVAWGGDSIKDLSKSVQAALLKGDKFKDKVKVKAAMAEGLVISFDRALTMPTRKEAIGEIVAAMMGPAASIASALTAGASQLASQIQKISERKPEEAAA